MRSLYAKIVIVDPIHLLQDSVTTHFTLPLRSCVSFASPHHTNEIMSNISAESSTDSFAKLKHPFHRLRSRNSDKHIERPEKEAENPKQSNHPHKLRHRAATLLHLNNNKSFDTDAKLKRNLRSRERPPQKKEPASSGGESPGPASHNLQRRHTADTPHRPKKEIMHYNPYGLNSPSPSVMGSRPNASFYLSDDEDRKNLLPTNVESPNDFLPSGFKQESVELLDGYTVPEKVRKLGVGASSDVRTIVQRDSGRVYALKKFTLLESEKPHEFYKRASKEFIIAKTLDRSPHVVDCLALVKFPTTGALNRGWGFVLGYCKGGDLFNLISSPTWKSVPLCEKYCLFKQVAYGVKYMHECDIVHRDLKPENVLVDERGVAKLTDFGVSDFGHETPGDFRSNIKMCSAFVGSPPYVPPEVMVLRNCKTDPRPQYDPFKMDMWALGMLLFCIVYQGTPFTEASKTHGQFRDFYASYKAYLSKNPWFKNSSSEKKSRGPGVEYRYAREFQDPGASRSAWRLCDDDPATRYTIVDLFNDSWFQGLEMCINEDSFECNYCNHEGYTGHCQVVDDGFPAIISRKNSTSSFTASGSARNTNHSISSRSSSRHDPGTPESLPRAPIRSMLDAEEPLPPASLPPLKEEPSQGMKPKMGDLEEVDEEDHPEELESVSKVAAEKDTVEKSENVDPDSVKTTPQDIPAESPAVESSETVLESLSSGSPSVENELTAESNEVFADAEPSLESLTETSFDAPLGWDAVMTEEGPRNIIFSDCNCVVDFECIRKASCCRIKKHNHLDARR